LIRKNNVHCCSSIIIDFPRTGLDPATREFETFNSSYRLDVNDANFVDILHTSAIGIQVAFGDADFYPNGGVVQPCGSNPGIRLHFKFVINSVN
jgi:hypothetical protein